MKVTSDFFCESLYNFLPLKLLNLQQMKRNYFIVLFALMSFAGKSFAQKTAPCATDAVYKQLLLTHPELAQSEANYNKQIAEGLKKINFNGLKKTTFVDQTGNEDFWYDIPIVIHFVHDYGIEYLSDDEIYNDLIDWNKVYAHQNYDTISVIAPFIKYEGNPHIRLHLATKDPNGKPTHGITRHRDYNTYFGSDQAKFNDWPNTSYINIWIINVITQGGGVAAAYAYMPSTGAVIPQGDGIICDYGYAANWYQNLGQLPYKTINHEMGHCLSLYHPWGGTNDAGLTCGDDEVDDTPPTKGHVIGSVPEGCDPRSLYDTTCARNYFKIYPTPSGTDSIVNYPDTTNAQNIMDYTFCSLMFTKGQVYRMHEALNSDVAGRNNLWDKNNLFFTGVTTDSAINAPFAPRPDLKPIPEFSATVSNVNAYQYFNRVSYFAIPGINITFRNKTWNDTLTSLVWTFTNNATNPTYASATHPSALTSFTNSFTDPGWVDIKMTATGNNTGDTTVDFPRSVFVADATGTPTATYYQDFNKSDTAKWPTFNYYNNEFKWQMANVGYADNSSMSYLGYDKRIVTNPLLGYDFPNTGSPFGDFDDMFSVPFDLSNFSGSASLNYFYAGATRSSSSVDINDTLEIYYYTKNNPSWQLLTKLTKEGVANRGAMSIPFVPTSDADWAHMGINLPSGALTNYTIFKFRYRPSVAVGRDGTVNTGSNSSGNNFYMDKLFFSPYPAEVATIMMDKMDVAVAPNPTTGDAYVIVRDADKSIANIVVSDVTGKVVYRTSEQLNGSETRILIPHAAISVSGMYFIQTSTGNQTRTQKLVVE